LAIVLLPEPAVRDAPRARRAARQPGVRRRDRARSRALALSQNADGSWGADGDPYETALAVAALAGHQAHATATRRGVEHLLASMAADGSWTSRACVWEFHSDERDVWRAYDTHRAYVSARCTIALRRAATP
jgi:anti-sigma-K factor RskA